MIFKGKGFYQTDYRSDAYTKSAEKDKPPSAKSADADSGKSKPPEKKDPPATKQD